MLNSVNVTEMPYHDNTSAATLTAAIRSVTQRSFRASSRWRAPRVMHARAQNATDERTNMTTT